MNSEIKLEKLEVQITSNCNFKCYYCGNNPLMRNESISLLDYDVFKKCVDELNPKELVITGGEPGLAMEEVKRFFTYSKSKGISNTLTSNLSLFNRNDLKELVDFYGVTKFNSSFNDLNVEMSRNIRGISDKERDTICDNISYITQSLKVPLRIETLLLKETIPYICEINEFLYKLGLRHHALEFLNPHGYAGNDKTRKIYEIADRNFKFTNCQDGKRIAYLLSDGRLIPCFMYSGEISDNDVNTTSPAYIFEYNPIFQKVKREVPKKCSKCHYYYNADDVRTCNNGCWAMLLMETGNMTDICCEYIERRMGNEQ